MCRTEAYRKTCETPPYRDAASSFRARRDRVMREGIMRCDQVARSLLTVGVLVLGACGGISTSGTPDESGTAGAAAASSEPGPSVSDGHPPKGALATAHPDACQCPNGCPTCVDPGCGGDHQPICTGGKVTQTCTLCDCETYQHTCTPPQCGGTLVACQDPCQPGVFLCVSSFECSYCTRRLACLTMC